MIKNKHICRLIALTSENKVILIAYILHENRFFKILSNHYWHKVRFVDKQDTFVKGL